MARQQWACAPAGRPRRGGASRGARGSRARRSSSPAARASERARCVRESRRERAAARGGASAREDGDLGAARGPSCDCSACASDPARARTRSPSSSATRAATRYALAEEVAVARRPSRRRWRFLDLAAASSVLPRASAMRAATTLEVRCAARRGHARTRSGDRTRSRARRGRRGRAQAELREVGDGARGGEAAAEASGGSGQRALTARAPRRSRAARYGDDAEVRERVGARASSPRRAPSSRTRSRRARASSRRPCEMSAMPRFRRARSSAVGLAGRGRGERVLGEVRVGLLPWAAARRILPSVLRRARRGRRASSRARWRAVACSAAT